MIMEMTTRMVMITVATLVTTMAAVITSDRQAGTCRLDDPAGADAAHFVIFDCRLPMAG